MKNILKINSKVYYFLWTFIKGSIPLSLIIIIFIEYFTNYFTFENPKILANIDNPSY